MSKVELAAGKSARRWRFSTTMRRLRERAGLSVKEAADAIGKRPSTIYRIEDGSTGTPQIDTLEGLLEVYGVRRGAERDALIDLARHPDVRGWWQSYAGLPPGFVAFLGFEHEASTLDTYDTMVVPGLLQTSAYTEAVIRLNMPGEPEDEVRRRLEIRERRKAVLTRPKPLRLRAIVDRAAIVDRPVGGWRVMAEQLRALLALPPNVTLRVLDPRTGKHPGLEGPFVLVGFDGLEVVFVESTEGQFLADDGEQLIRHRAMWNHVDAAALSVEKSAALIREAAREAERRGS